MSALHTTRKQTHRTTTVAAAFRITQIVFGIISIVLESIGGSSGVLILPILSATGLIGGMFGLVALYWPEKLHWHVMLGLDFYAFAASSAAMVCSLFFGTALWIGVIFTTSISIVAVMAASIHFAVVNLSGRSMASRAPAFPKDLQEDELDYSTTAVAPKSAAHQVPRELNEIQAASVPRADKANDSLTPARPASIAATSQAWSLTSGATTPTLAHQSIMSAAPSYRTKA